MAVVNKPRNTAAMDQIRRQFLLLTAGFGVAATAPSLAYADVPQSARSAFDQGNYLRAATLAEAAGDADGLAFAARARLATALLVGVSRIAASEVSRSRALAERALALAPNHVEGRLQLAIALGLQARRMAPALALARGAPQRVRSILDGVCADAPREPWGHAILGSWHLEGVRLAGSAANQVLGAQTSAGNAAFARATSLSSSPTFPAMHAIAVLSANGTAPSSRLNISGANPLLATAVARSPVTAFDRELSRRANDLTRLIARNDTSAIKSRLASWL